MVVAVRGANCGDGGFWHPHWLAGSDRRCGAAGRLSVKRAAKLQSKPSWRYSKHRGTMAEHELDDHGGHDHGHGAGHAHAHAPMDFGAAFAIGGTTALAAVV